jgi:hypothetical protein
MANPNDQENSQLPAPRFDNDIVTMRFARREVVMHPVTSSELDDIASTGLSHSLNLALFGISMGGLIGFGTALATGQIIEVKVFASFTALTAVTLMSSILFGVRSCLDYKKAKAKIREITSGRL